MPVDYKKELEIAAKNMIIVHDPDVLIKMLVRMVVQKVKVNHASMLLYNKEKQAYLLTISRGSLGKKIPIGLARMDKDDALIYLFKTHNDKLLFKNEAITHTAAQKILKKSNLKKDARLLLEQVIRQMQILETVVCIPSYFREELVAVLLLGKKNNNKSFGQKELDFFVALSSDVAMAIKNAWLFKELENELDKRRQLFIRTAIAMAVAIEAKDPYTHGHTTRVTNLSIEIAKRIIQKNGDLLDGKFLENLHIASLLHDIGKIGIPEHILNKDGPLNEGERAKIREHPLIGATILKPINELNESLLGIKYHHERYDGQGYPEGLKGNQIPMIASIISVADSFDTMVSYRPYRPALSKESAREEIKKQSGKQFHPQVAKAFLELCNEGKI